MICLLNKRLIGFRGIYVSNLKWGFGAIDVWAAVVRVFVRMSPVRCAHRRGPRAASGGAAQDVLVCAHDVAPSAVVEVSLVLSPELLVRLFITEMWIQLATHQNTRWIVSTLPDLLFFLRGAEKIFRLNIALAQSKPHAILEIRKNGTI